MFWLDSALRVTWVNRAWEDLTGRTAESVLGMHCVTTDLTEAGVDGDLAASVAPPPEALAGQPSGCLARIFHVETGRIWRRVEFWPFHGRTGALLGLLGQVREPDGPPSVPDSQTMRVRTQLWQVREQLHQSFGVESLIGTGPSHRRIMDQIRLAASTAVPVLLIGEPGTGKRLVASMIHQLSARREQPLLPFDCEALSAEVLERELFSPGNQADEPETAPPLDQPPRPSRLTLAEGSTLVIGEILALPRDLQGRLAEALDGRARLIATTSGDPEHALRLQQLRPDLYYAITTLVLKLEPLRQRRHELPLLAQHFLERANERWRWFCGGLTQAAIEAICSYDWPGNLRELARVLDAAYTQARTRPAADWRDRGLLIDVDDLPASILGNLGAAYLPPAPASPIKPLDELLTEIERRLIETALIKARQNKSRAAELLGISRPRLYRRIKELNLPDESEPEAEALPASPSEQGVL
jgi:DNA-binding NtrC family response regulator